MRIKHAQLEVKAENTTQARIPPNLDAGYEDIYEAVVESQRLVNSAGSLPIAIRDMTIREVENFGPKSCKRGNWVAISNIEISKTHQNMTIEEEVAECFSTLEGQ